MRRRLADMETARQVEIAPEGVSVSSATSVGRAKCLPRIVSRKRA